MEIAIRNWVRSDAATIAMHWITAVRAGSTDEGALRHDAEAVLAGWVVGRVRDRGTLGYVAECNGEFGGFGLGRVADWDTEPPILKPVRVGVIEAIYVCEPVRRLGVGIRLVEHLRTRLEARGAARIETSIEAGDEAATRMWGKMGFTSRIEMASADVERRQEAFRSDACSKALDPLN